MDDFNDGFWTGSLCVLLVFLVLSLLFVKVEIVDEEVLDVVCSNQYGSEYVYDQSNWQGNIVCVNKNELEPPVKDRKAIQKR